MKLPTISPRLAGKKYRPLLEPIILQDLEDSARSQGCYRGEELNPASREKLSPEHEEREVRNFESEEHKDDGILTWSMMGMKRMKMTIF